MRPEGSRYDASTYNIEEGYSGATISWSQYPSDPYARVATAAASDADAGALASEAAPTGSPRCTAGEFASPPATPYVGRVHTAASAAVAGR